MQGVSGGRGSELADLQVIDGCRRLRRHRSGATNSVLRLLDRHHLAPSICTVFRPCSSAVRRRRTTATMVRRRNLSPQSVWDFAAVEEAFRVAGAKPSHIPRLYK